MADTIIYKDSGYSRSEPLYRGTQLVWYLFYALETILLFRFVLKLIGANPGAAFTSFVYALSYPFVAPFQAVTSNSSVLGSSIEWTTLIAMLVYWVLAWGIVRLIAMGRPVTHTEAREGLREQDVA